MAEGITWEQLMERLRGHYGEAGPLAAETSCLDRKDLTLGYDHCVDRILPALEEELVAQGDLEIPYRG